MLSLIYFACEYKLFFLARIINKRQLENHITVTVLLLMDESAREEASGEVNGEPAAVLLRLEPVGRRRRSCCATRRRRGHK